METTLCISGLTKQYKRSGTIFTAVNNLSFSAQAGQVVGFLGANGAGKTTTIKMVCGLIEQTEGTITLAGNDSKRSRTEAMLSLGAVLEGTRNIYWNMTAEQNLFYFGRLKGVFGTVLQARTEKLLKQFDLYGVRHEAVGKFSRGMQQKVALCCALIHDPKIVLLDEPTLGLDVEASRVLSALVKELAHTHKKTVLLTTHQLDTAEELCDRIIVMNKGRMIVDMGLEELRKKVSANYGVVYKLVLEGVFSEDLVSLACPSALQISYEGSRTQFSLAFNHESDSNQLLLLLAQKNIPVVQFLRQEPELEDIFISLTSSL